MRLIDSHAHLTSSDLKNELPAILERAKAAGVSHIINICTDIASLELGLELAKTNPWIKTACAYTPHEAAIMSDEDFNAVAARAPLLQAIGETGLDYHYEHSPRGIQKTVLIRFLKLALDTSLPVIIHCRDAFDDFFEILDEVYLSQPQNKGGVLHCFTGTADEARRVIERGFYLSLSGIVTFKKSLELQEVARQTPLEKLLVETDAPYLAPQKHRGKQNEPAYVVETAQFIADLKGIPLEELAKAITSNALSLFKDN
jgi:TatD DNase family protein